MGPGPPNPALISETGRERTERELSANSETGEDGEALYPPNGHLSDINLRTVCTRD